MAVRKCIEEYESKQIEVYIAYMIPGDSYTKHWDLLVYGNLGTTKMEELLDFKRQCAVFVLKDENKLNRQSHFELISHIKENYRKIDEVQGFDVYQTW